MPAETRIDGKSGMAHGESRKVIVAALSGNLAIAVTKLGAALYTGSGSMRPSSSSVLIQ